MDVGVIFFLFFLFFFKEKDGLRQGYRHQLEALAFMVEKEQDDAGHDLKFPSLWMKSDHANESQET